MTIGLVASMNRSKKYSFLLLVFILFFSFLAYQNLAPYIGIHLAKNENTYITHGFNDLAWGWKSGIIIGEEQLEGTALYKIKVNISLHEILNMSDELN